MKLFSFIDLFRKGYAVTEPETWKDAGNATAALSALFIAAVEVARALGYDVQITTDQAVSVAGGVSTVVLWITHNITSKHAGILPAKPVQEPVPESKPVEATAVSPVDVSAHGAIDDATRQRAEEWIKNTYIG